MNVNPLCDVTIKLSLCLSALACALVAPVNSVHAQARDAGVASPAADAGISPAEQARRATVLARVGETVITVGEFEDTLNQAPAPVRQTYTDLNRQREYLQNMVDTIVLAREAERRHVERDPEVANQIRRILAQRLQQVELVEAINAAGVTEADVRTFYQEHVGDWVQDEQRRATVVFLNDRAAAEDIMRQARAARGNLRTIQELAHTRSVDEHSRENRGDFFYFRATHTTGPGNSSANHVGPDAGAAGADAGVATVDPAVSRAAFGLARELDVSEPVQCANGKFAVVILTGIRPALSRSIEDPGVRASIISAVVHARRRTREQQLLGELRTRHHIEEHPERVDRLRIPATDLGGMPAFEPGGAAGVPRRPENDSNGRNPVPVRPAREPIAR